MRLLILFGKFEVPAPSDRMCLIVGLSPGQMGTTVGFGAAGSATRVELRLQRLTTGF